MTSRRAFEEGLAAGSSRGDLAPGIRFGASDIENEGERGEEADRHVKRVSIHTAFFEPRTKLFRVVCKFLVAVPEVTKILTVSRAFTNSRPYVFTY